MSSKATENLPGKGTEVASKAFTADTCFVIMPFGGWFDRYYAEIYKPAVEAAGLVPRRADDLFRPSMIINDIWSYTQQCKIVLADLTGRNENVFYELGLAHALAKPAVLVTEIIEDVPFDLRHLRVIQYQKNEPGWGEILSRAIERAIREVLSSPVTAVLPAFLSVDTAATPPTVSEAEKNYLDLRQEVELLRAEIRSVVGTRPRNLTARQRNLTARQFDELHQELRALRDEEYETSIRLLEAGPSVGSQEYDAMKKRLDELRLHRESLEALVAG